MGKAGAARAAGRVEKVAEAVQAGGDPAMAEEVKVLAAVVTVKVEVAKEAAGRAVVGEVKVLAAVEMVRVVVVGEVEEEQVEAVSQCMWTPAC